MRTAWCFVAVDAAFDLLFLAATVCDHAEVVRLKFVVEILALCALLVIGAGTDVVFVADAGGTDVGLCHGKGFGAELEKLILSHCRRSLRSSHSSMAMSTKMLVSRATRPEMYPWVASVSISTHCSIWWNMMRTVAWDLTSAIANFLMKASAVAVLSRWSSLRNGTIISATALRYWSRSFIIVVVFAVQI